MCSMPESKEDAKYLRRPPKPKVLTPKFDAIPMELRTQPWVMTRLDWNGRKWTKPPYSPKGYKVDKTDPANWCTFDQARAAYERGGFDGVGVVLTGKPNAAGKILLALDYDGAVSRNVSGGREVIPAARALMDEMPTYWEPSISGTGLRGFAWTDEMLPNRKSTVDGHSVEFYTDAAYVTVTGKGAGDIAYISNAKEIHSRIFSGKGKPSAPMIQSNVHGRQSMDELPILLRARIKSMTSPLNAALSGDKLPALFNGDTSFFQGDHSAADLAFAGLLAKRGFTPEEVDLAMRASGLMREKWDEMRGANTYGQMTLSKAFEGRPVVAANGRIGEQATVAWWDVSNLSRYRPGYVAGGMPARKFIGPQISVGARLFPVSAVSILVALGAVGKTSLLLSVVAHVAAGKNWNGYKVEQQKAAMFFCEETDEEVKRKFSAVVDGWLPTERQAAIDNLLLVPLLGEDVRLAAIRQGQYFGSGIAENMIALLNDFGLKGGLVVIDHMQGFASGDLNISETATSICREANKIVDATGSAVVFAAHISKANIKATELEQGFAVGSLAFENAARQMAGMLPMPEEEAKKYGLEADRQQYVWLGLPKNSYGEANAGVWLKKEVNPKYHTVVMNPVSLVVPLTAARKSANEKLADKLIEYISQHPKATKSQLDGVAGNDGPLKASKEKVRDVLRGLLDTGGIELHTVTDAERQEHGIPKQVKEVLRVKPADSSPPIQARRIMPANTKGKVRRLA